MDCDTARALIAFRRPGPPELSPEDLAALDGHLAECPACAAAARRAEAFDAALAAAMARVVVPPDLRRNLLRQLDRRSAARWRRSAGAMAAAAVLLFTVTGGSYWAHRANRPALDADAVASYQDELVRGPDVAVADWLRGQGLPPGLPLDVDFRHYAFHGTALLLGRDVPVVVFQAERPNQPPEVLRLYVIRDRDFKLDTVTDARGSFYAVRVLHDDRAGSGVLYLAAFTSPTLDPFLKRGGLVG